MGARLLTLCLLLAAAPSSLAMSSFDLSGTVLDESGLPLAGATLTLVHQSSGLTRTASTNDAGRYEFPVLPPGVYSLEAKLAAYATSRYAGLRYFADTKPIFNVTLHLREVQESMTFTGEAPLVNVSQSQVGLSVEERQLQDLPLARRDYLELVNLEGPAREIPEGPPGGPVFGAPLESLNGKNAHYTAYQLDGFQNTRDQHGVVHQDAGLDAVEEFRVISGQFSSEYGSSLAGIVSAATKAGGNDFHGSLYALLRPGGMSARDPLTSQEVPLDRQEGGFTFSGPLRREKTHFFVALDYRNQHEDVAVTSPFEDGRFRGVYDLPSERTQALVKLSHAFTSRHQLTAKALFSRASSVDGVGGFDIYENALDVENDDAAFFATLVSDVGSALSELRVGFASEAFRSGAGPPPLGAAMRYPLQGNIGNPTRLERADEDHFELAETLSFVAGQHSLKAGLGLLRIGSTSELLRFGDGLFLYSPENDPEPILYWQRVGAPESSPPLERNENHFQAFFQDDWQLSPYVTLNLGLRWEKESSVPDDDNFGPQVGFHWDATSDGRTSVRGGYGIDTSSVFSLVDSLERLYGPAGFGVAAFPLSSGTSGVRTAENLYVDAPVYSKESRRSPRAQHVNLGLTREWVKSLSVGLDLSYVRGSDLILPTDLNAPSFFDYGSGATRSATEADATRPFGVPGVAVPEGAVPSLPGGFPFSGYRDLYLLASRGTSRFWGLRLEATKRYQSSYMLQAIYQWSRTRNDGDDYRVDASLPLDPARPENEWGPSATDIPHSLVVNGIWDAPFGFRVAGIFRARSGRPVEPRVGIDLDGDLKLRERGFRSGELLGRNGFRGPAVATIDLSFSKSWELSEARRILAALDVFNLANRLNPLQILDTYGASPEPLPSFLEIVRAASPRQFQISFRFVF